MGHAHGSYGGGLRSHRCLLPLRAEAIREGYYFHRHENLKEVVAYRQLASPAQATLNFARRRGLSLAKSLMKEETNV